MYIVMLILRYLVGIQGGELRDLRLAPVRARVPHWCHELPIPPSPLSVSSGPVNVHLPIRSPLQYRRRANLSSASRSRRHGPEGGPPLR